MTVKANQKHYLFWEVLFLYPALIYLNIARDYFSLLFHNTLYVTKEQTKKKERERGEGAFVLPGM